MLVLHLYGIRNIVYHKKETKKEKKKKKKKKDKVKKIKRKKESTCLGKHADNHNAMPLAARSLPYACPRQLALRVPPHHTAEGTQ